MKAKTARSLFLRDKSSALVFCICGLIFALPAFLLPFLSLSKFGNTHTSHLINTSDGLWRNGMPILSSWVFFCGMLAPLILLVLMTFIAWRDYADIKIDDSWMIRAARFMAQWAMPEVLALGVLVSFFKVNDLVSVKIGGGFWCYMMMVAMLILALRNFALDAEDAHKKAA